LKNSRGFTVLEMTIAFAILAMAITAIYGTVGTAAARGARLRGMEPAITLAESLLAEYSEDALYQPSDAQGVEDQFAWRVETRPYETTPGDSSVRAPLVVVRVHVAWNAAGSRSLDLVQLAAARYPSSKP
jgi:general secretion pathway protein I